MAAREVSPPYVRVFGGAGVDSRGEPVNIGGVRQRRLLALLAIRSGSVLSIDWLAEQLWTDDDRPEATAPAIRTYISRLRQRVPAAARDWIATEPAGYRFDAPAEQVEHLHFASLRERARQARDGEDPQTAQDLLDEALGLWRGDPFAELEDLDWARPEIEQLRQDRLEMLEERWEAALAQGRHTQITGELAAFTAEHGLRERATRQHALALHRSGRTAEALRVLRAHRQRLADESGLDPSPAVVELEQALLVQDPSLDIELVGRPLRGYRLVEEIGTGAFAVVWRGVQPSVDREVAVKQIRPELASQPEFIRRFEAEAQLVARVEHPHIVPLIDFWRDPDSAYLVMRWLRGGTLERRLDDGPLTVEQTCLLARQLCGALGAAHAHGIVHRDVKAGNVLFDEAGNAFLGDFGIALEAAASARPGATLSTGSPAYASPEQLRREPLGPEADIFSLGVVLFECLVGSLPFSDSDSTSELVDRRLTAVHPSVADLRPDVPTPIADAIARATALDPGDRFGSAAALLDALEGHGRARTRSRADVDAVNPYKGLRPFDDGDADSFFGRERLVSKLVERLSGDTIRARCVVVVGPSGSGKSSVVRAGLTPAIRAGAAPGSETWFTTTMVPGTHPFESLEASLLRIAVNPPVSLLSQLRDGPRGILRCLRRCLTSDDQRVFVVMDQFEELFTRSDAEVASDFLEALTVAIEDPTSPLRLVITLRADYYDRPLAHPTFSRVLDAVTVNLTPLAPDELERAMVEPARRTGVEFEPGLVARIAAETYGQASPLPLLQYVLSELFDRRGERLTIATYDEIGGLAGALAARAEAIHTDADDGQQAAIRRVFGRMTDPGAVSADVRRRVPLSDLGDDPETRWVLDAFGAARLVSFDRDDATREPTVEVAHEALLREWPRLVGWLEEDLDVLRSTDAVASAANAWDAGGRVSGDLYRGGRLEHAVELALTAPDRLRPVDTAFIDASAAAAAADRDAEQRRVRRLRRLVVGVGVALVSALVAGAIAFQQRNDAQDATATAELATLISRSAAVAADDAELSILLALEAHRRAPGPETEQAVLGALGSSTLAARGSSLDPADPDDVTSVLVQRTIDVPRSSVPLFGEGSVVVTDPETFEIESIDLDTGTRTPVSLGTRPDMAFQPAVVWSDGDDFLALSVDGQYARWTNGEMVDHIRVPRATDAGAFLNGADWTGDRVVMGAALGPPGSTGGTREWYHVDTTPGELEVVATVTDSAVVAPIAADDGFRLFRDDGLLRSYDPTGTITGEIDTGLRRPPFPLSPHTVWARSEDDRLVALGNGTGVVIVDTTTRTTTRVPTFGGTESLLFARGDSVLMVGGDDGTVRAWDVERDTSRGVLWRGPSEVTFSTWYDDESDSLWIAEEQRLLELPLNPDVYLARACEVVDRDLTQDEWNQYVPGGGPVRSACP